MFTAPERDIVDRDTYVRCVARFRDIGLRLPTISELADPASLPGDILAKLATVDPDAADPHNLYRVHWHNAEDRRSFAEVPEHMVLPPELTGVDARIVGLLGKWFPTGAHKVGAAYGCLAPRLVSGSFDPTSQKAVWPSTGNYCRGGAYDCALLACPAVAILPEGMSRERFDWLRSIGTDEVIATPGTESNVKEIYDKCWELR